MIQQYRQHRRDKMAAIRQNYEIYEQNGLYFARGAVDMTTLCEGPDASVVIQDALNRVAGAGGEVHLQPGDYPLAQPLRLADKVRLSGSGRGSTLHVGGEMGIFGERSHGVTVTNLALMPAATGEARNGSNASEQTGVCLSSCGDCTLKNLYVTGFDGYGIRLREHSFLCHISDCHLSGNARTNLLLEDQYIGEYGDFVPNLVTGCTIYGGGKGIETKRAIVVNIVGCQVYQTQGTAFHIHSESNSVLISGCRSFQITGCAVVVEDTDEFNLSSNIFCWHTEHGVVVRRARWGAIVGNEIIDTGSYNTTAVNFTDTQDQVPPDFTNCIGLDLDDVHGYNITGNTIFNWGVCPPMQVGIRENGACFSNIIGNNNINYFLDAPLTSQGRETIVGPNQGYAEAAHQVRSMGNVLQTFRPQRTLDFIRRLSTGNE
jgi:hypothetical protein